MTSDAKIGLLLGLVFIFIIAFIINGLPSFRNDTNELTTDGMVTLQNGLPENMVKEPKGDIFNRPGPIRRQPGEDMSLLGDENDIRSRIPMSDILGAARDTSFMTDISLVEATEKKIVPIVPGIGIEDKSIINRPEPIKQAAPKTYVILKGDNLATVAKKFYGPEEGNKRANITRIFQANNKLLKSPDAIYEGQKLIIPPLPASTPSKDTSSGALSASIFEKVKSIGRKGISVVGGGATNTKKYVVKEGDSLWKIAAEQLGSGSRYKEIGKLNSDVLTSDDSLRIGTALNMPAK